jgi:hypothetical protein
MKLPHKVEKTFVVQVEDLEKLISEHYGVEFDFMQVENPYTPMDCQFTVEARFDEPEVFKGGEYKWMSAGDILDHLAGKGLIEQGNYYIEVNL